MAAPTFDEILRHLGETGERAKTRANAGLDQGERWANSGLKEQTATTTLAHVSPGLARPEPAPMLEISPLAPLARPAEEKRPIPPDLAALIQRAATFYGYSPDDLATIQQSAQRDPAGLRLALEADPLHPFMIGKTLDGMMGMGQLNPEPTDPAARPCAGRGGITR